MKIAMTEQLKAEAIRNIAMKPMASMVNFVDIKMGKCAFPPCGKDIAGFKDELSAREYVVSGMCQVCQDAIFG